MFFGLCGLLLVVFGSSVHDWLQWLWPPALLVLSVWMFLRARHQLRSRSRWLLYPVIGFLFLASLGGGWETVSEATDPDVDAAAGRLIDVGGHQLEIELQNRDERQQPESQAITGEYTTPAELDDGSDDLTEPGYVPGEPPARRR